MKYAHNNPALTFLQVKDVQFILGYKTYKGAWLHVQLIRDSLGKKGHQRLTVEEFANWEGLNANTILQQLQY